jgi:hypothetical protein
MDLLALATLASTLSLAAPARADVRVCLEDDRGNRLRRGPRAGRRYGTLWKPSR